MQVLAEFAKSQTNQNSNSNSNSSDVTQSLRNFEFHEFSGNVDNIDDDVANLDDSTTTAAVETTSDQQQVCCSKRNSCQMVDNDNDEDDGNDISSRVKCSFHTSDREHIVKSATTDYIMSPNDLAMAMMMFGGANNRDTHESESIKKSPSETKAIISDSDLDVVVVSAPTASASETIRQSNRRPTRMSISSDEDDSCLRYVDAPENNKNSAADDDDDNNQEEREYIVQKCKSDDLNASEREEEANSDDVNCAHEEEDKNDEDECKEVCQLVSDITSAVERWSVVEASFVRYESLLDCYELKADQTDDDDNDDNDVDDDDDDDYDDGGEVTRQRRLPRREKRSASSVIASDSPQPPPSSPSSSSSSNANHSISIINTKSTQNETQSACYYANPERLNDIDIAKMEDKIDNNDKNAKNTNANTPNNNKNNYNDYNNESEHKNNKNNNNYNKLDELLRTNNTSEKNNNTKH